MSKKNLIVGQSGGPTAVINCSLYGVVAEGLAHPDMIEHIYGMVNGIEGFLNGTILDFSEALPGASLEGLTYTPGAYLGSCRYKLPESLDDPVYPRLFEKFEEMNIGWFYYIGGNDSMDTVSKLSRYAESIGSEIRFLGEPKTIDNDLVLTDHTPGFGSAAKYVATTVREIVLDANVYEKKSVTIVEIMGRHAGWLTGASALARKFNGDNPLFIYLPEVAFDQEVFLKNIEDAFTRTCNVIVCVSEGIHDKDGVFICEYDNNVGTDTFGHKMLAGCGKYLENLVRNRLGVKARSVELNVSQRCSSAMLSDTDRQEAIRAGRFGVQAGLRGETGKMIAFVREADADGAYSMRCSLEDVNQICNAEKPVPLSWITEDFSDVTEEFVAYAKPLVQGNVDVPVGEDGLPAFVYRPSSLLK
jgi:6-phosphofructokinase 1